MMTETKEGISFLSFSVFKDCPVRAGVSTRKGGVSRVPYDTLNLAFHVGDEEAAVRENRFRFCRALGIDGESLITAKQVHGTLLRIVGEDESGQGAWDYADGIDDCDGLVTDERCVPIGLCFADCVPLLFCDPLRKAVAVVHAGWRGTAGNIAEKTISLLRREYGCRAEDVRVAIGPAIGQAHFETGKDVAEALSPLFSKEEREHVVRRRKDDTYYIDLPQANQLLLLRNGITEAHMENVNIDTAEQTGLFYSYRADGGVTGRHMAVMMIL